MATQKTYSHYRPFVVEIRYSPAHTSLQIEAKSESDAKAIGERFMKNDETISLIVVRRVKGFVHGKCFKWTRARGSQWEESAFYNQWNTGDRSPRLQRGDMTLFGAVV